MSVATTQPAHKSWIRIPRLTPLYGAHLESFCAQIDGTYRCGSGAASEFCVAFCGAEATHCSFIHKSGTFSVKRIDGRVWVNDLPVSGLYRLTEGDVISLGPVSYRLEYQDATSHLPEPDDRPLMSFRSAPTITRQTSADLTAAAIPIPVVIAAPSAPGTSIQTALQIELQAVEHAKLENSRQEAELRLLREEIQAAQAELLNRDSQQQVRESEFLLLCDEYDSRETSLSQRALELLTKTETQALLEIALSDRARAVTDAEQTFAAASVKADTRIMEQLAAIEAKREELDRREAEIVERAVRLCTVGELQKALQSNDSKLRQTNEELDLLDAELAESVRYADELKAKLAEYSLSANPVSPVQQAGTGFGSGESCEALSRELDLRAELLDRRDEELRERSWKIELAEGDIESQRRLLLEARQQLDQARAEIHVAMRKHTEPSLPAALVDLSETPGEIPAAVFHFGSDAAQLAEPDSTLTANGDAEPAREIYSHDVLRDHMEQLLSRYRKSAGTALPSELAADDRDIDPAATSTAKVPGRPSPGSAPKVKSYIEQYMAGHMGDLSSSESLTMSEPDIDTRQVASFDVQRPVQLSPKMDLVKLKENMVSFRTLSTQSVENALASYAIKVERLGFSGRLVIAVLLTMITLLLGIANTYGAIDAPMPMWVTLTSAIAIWTESYSRYLAIAVHTRNPQEILPGCTAPLSSLSTDQNWSFVKSEKRRSSVCLQSHGLTEDRHYDIGRTQERWRDSDIVSVHVWDVF